MLAVHLLLLVFNEIAGNFLESDLEIIPLVDALITLDNFLIFKKRSVLCPSYHVYVVCQKTENPITNANSKCSPTDCANLPDARLGRTHYKPAASWDLIAAEPNPFPSDPLGVGETTVSWMTYATSNVEVHVDAPDGLLFCPELDPGRFSQPTGPWVHDGTKFYLQNVSKGLPLAAENTIATVTLRSM